MEYKIKLNEKSVQEFVKAAERCAFDIDVYQNRIIIDGKSLLGMLSMDLSNVLNVNCYGSDDKFEKILSKFMVK